MRNRWGSPKAKRGRQSLLEQVQKNHERACVYASALRKPVPPKPQILIDLENSSRAHRSRTRSTPWADGRPLERDVLKQVIAAFKADPRVASVERNQSGVFQDGDRYIRVGSRGKLDLTVYLTDGRYLECEVKRGQQPSLLREQQRKRIQAIRSSGGLAGWCWSRESALALLP